MFNLADKLRSRDDPIRVGVIGAGIFGTKLVDQIERTPGMTTAVIADARPEKAVQAFREAGIQGESVFRTSEASGVAHQLSDGRRAVMDDGITLTETDIDVVVEATGSPNHGARHAYEAMSAGKDVVMATVEADTVVGPELSEHARTQDVTYSMAYGDQPALIVELCDWATAVGLDIVAAGKGNRFREQFRYGTPEDIFDRFGLDDSFVDSHDPNPRLYNSFLDGTKAAVEMCAAANATGLRPDVTGMHFPTAGISEIPELLCPKSDGGVLNQSGAVETVSTIRDDGTRVEEDLSFGVFVVTTTSNTRVQEYLEQKDGAGFFVSHGGKYQIFYRSFHLPGTESTISIAGTALLDEPTGVPRSRVGEVIGAAKTELQPGDELDGGGGYTIYGLLTDAEHANREDFVPFELLEGATVTSHLQKDDIVTYDDVELEESTFIYQLRNSANGP